MRLDCFDPNELDEILALPPDDPRLAHADECPACRALLDSYRAFLRPEKLAEPSDLGAARPRLTEFIRREIGGEGSAGRGKGADPFPGRPRRRASFLRLRPVLAAAALFLLVLTVPRLIERRGGAPVSGVLREPESSGRFVAEATADESGDILFTWNAAAGADAYRVVLYGGDLAEIASFDVGNDTKFLLRRSDLPSGGARPPRLWRVVALERGDQTEQTDLLPLP